MRSSGRARLGRKSTRPAQRDLRKRHRRHDNSKSSEGTLNSYATTVTYCNKRPSPEGFAGQRRRLVQGRCASPQSAARRRISACRSVVGLLEVSLPSGCGNWTAALPRLLCAATRPRALSLRAVLRGADRCVSNARFSRELGHVCSRSAVERQREACRELRQRVRAAAVAVALAIASAASRRRCGCWAGNTSVARSRICSRASLWPRRAYTLDQSEHFVKRRLCTDMRRIDLQPRRLAR